MIDEFLKLKESFNDLDKKLLRDDVIQKNFLSQLINQFDKIDFHYLNECNKLKEDEYCRYTSLRYKLNFIHTILDDFEELKSSMNNISAYQKSIINLILIKLTDISDIVDMLPDDN